MDNKEYEVIFRKKSMGYGFEIVDDKAGNLPLMRVECENNSKMFWISRSDAIELSLLFKRYFKLPPFNKESEVPNG